MFYWHNSSAIKQENTVSKSCAQAHGFSQEFKMTYRRSYESCWVSEWVPVLCLCHFWRLKHHLFVFNFTTCSFIFINLKQIKTVTGKTLRLRRQHLQEQNQTSSLLINTAKCNNPNEQEYINTCDGPRVSWRRISHSFLLKQTCFNNWKNNM